MSAEMLTSVASRSQHGAAEGQYGNARNAQQGSRIFGQPWSDPGQEEPSAHTA